jgi:hypothetical protein
MRRGGEGRWRSRIVGHGEEPPNRLVANPRNWRLHPDAQRDALGGVLREVGWVQQVVVNRRTGFVVDGHLRVEMAAKQRQPTVPVVYVDLTEEEEALVLSTLDPIGAMAAADRAQLDALLDVVDTEDAGLKALLDDLRSQPAPEAPAATGNDLANVPAELAGAFALKPDMRFPSDHAFGVPALREDRLLDLPDGIALWAGDDIGQPAPAEGDLQAEGARLRPRPDEHLLGRVDADCAVPRLGQQKRQEPGAAADVERVDRLVAGPHLVALACSTPPDERPRWTRACARRGRCALGGRP